MVEESDKVKQKPEIEQSRGKDVGEKCNVSTGKCVAQKRL